METKWLEDFVSLAETRSFSRSAQLRHVTQPAFSRRIQSLEAWAGTDLVDRSSYPTRLTPAGQTLYEQALEMLQALQSTRAMLRAYSTAADDTIEFAVPHTLAFTFFPSWLSGLRKACGPIKCRLTALNVHDAVLRLVEGHADLLIAYHHASQPIQLDNERYEMLPLGEEVLAPYVKPDEHGQPLFLLPGERRVPSPLLGYGPGAYLGRMVDIALKQAAQPVHLNRVYETDMAEGLKAMALEGHGIAFLPRGAIGKELKAKRLVSAAPDGEGSFQIGFEIRMYRVKPSSSAKPPRGAATPKRITHDLWEYLAGRSGAVPASGAG